MAIRPFLSSLVKSGRLELVDTVNYTQLTTTESINLTSPVKIFVQPGYMGQVKVSLSNNDADQIRYIAAGDTAYLDEVNSAHKLWIKPTVSSVGYWLYFRYGEE